MLTNDFTEYELRAYLQKRNNWTDHTFDSISWTAYGAAISTLTDKVRTFVIKLSHGWLPVGVRERRCGAATDICPQCIQPETVPYLYLCNPRITWRDQFIVKLTKLLEDTSTAADLRCIIIQGIQNWFLTGDTNEPDNPDPIIQLGWFHVLKGYLPHQWNILQALFFRDQGLDTIY